MKSKTTIELNGTQYDAVTGAVIGAASTPAISSTKSIDGFFRSRSTITNHAKAHAPQAAKTTVSRPTETNLSKKPIATRSGSALNHTKAHSQQGSQTLMRKAVTRPEPSFHKQVHPVGALQHTVPGMITPKSSVTTVDQERLNRAQSTERSPHVTHHHMSSTNSVAPMPVRPEADVPLDAPAPEPPSTKPTPTDIFEHALANATNFVDIRAHRAQFKKKARMHVASIAAGSLALVLVAGFAAYVNSPTLQLKVASVKAGVSSTMPNLSSAGYSFGGVKAVHDKVLLGFSGNKASYQLTQQNTNMSSADMIESLAATDASGTPNYTTLQVGNISVYRFSNTSATWVQNGIWYTLSSTKAVSNTQVTTIVEQL